MKLNRKGFAVTGIIYSMLILFLALVLLILSNLASRKVLFDKEKNEILEKINGVILCTAVEPNMQNVWNESSGILEPKIVGVQATSSNPYAVGSVYICDLGDGARTFYVLKEDSDNIKLIMNENLGDKLAWCSSSNDNSCAADAVNSYLESQTTGWTAISQDQITLPIAQDIADAMGDEVWTAGNWTGTAGETWMYVNLDADGGTIKYHYGYWTSTSYSGDSNRAWAVDSRGTLIEDGVDEYDGYGVRPVITISKSNLSV